MAGHLFISYSRQDAGDFALRLVDELQGKPPQYRSWLDVREMSSGTEDWDDQLTEAIQTCDGLVFVMSDDSVRRGSGCKDEWNWALKYKKPVIPIRLHATADLPFRLGSRQYLDFAQDFDTGMAQLRNHLQRRTTAEGALQELRYRLADAERDLPRAEPAHQTRIRAEIDELRGRIDAQRRLMADPEAVAEATDARIVAGMERERQPERPVARPPQAKFVNPPPMTAPNYFQDRHVETSLIGDFLRDDRLRMLSVVGRGGVGKTAMVCRLLKALEGSRLPDELGELPVDGIVYLSSLGAHPVDFAHLFPDLCRLLAQDVAEPLLQRSHDPHETPGALMRALLDRFPAGRWVLLLDNFEDVVDADGVGLTDAALEEALLTVLRAPQHGVKVIVTTRVVPRNVLLVQPGVQRRLNLDEGLPSPFAEDVLRAMDPDASLGIRDGPAALLARARERTRGFPRALEALVAILAADRDTTLPELLADTERLPENVVEALVGDAFHRLDALAQQVMQALAIYPGPVPAVAVDYLLRPFQPAIDSAPILARLVNMQFVRSDAARYYLHQVDRDYAVQRIPEGEPGDRHASSPPFSRYALRERAADYFQQTRTPRETWRTVDDLAPQLAEIELRYQAGDYDAAAQVLLDISGEYLQRWGYVRHARDLHERVNGLLSDSWTNAANLTGLGTTNHVLGEMRRANEFYDQALTIYREIGDRGGEGQILINLGSTNHAFGEMRRAIEFYGQALTIYREIGDRGGEGNAVDSLGVVCSALGEVRRAIEFHEQALAIYREIGDRSGEGNALNHLGYASFALGEVRRAIEFYEQSLSIYRETGDRLSEGSALQNLGAAWSALGELRRAIEFYEQALTIYRETGDRAGEGGALSSLGYPYAVLGEARRAIELLERALVIVREIGGRPQEGIILDRLGIAHFKLGDARRAIEFHEQALSIYREIGDRLNEGGVLDNLGESCAASGEVSRAIEFHEQALAIHNETGRQEAQAISLINRAVAYADAGDWAQAIQYAEQGLRLADTIGLAQYSSEGRVHLATSYLHADELDLAQATAQAARGYDSARMSDNIALVLGIALARQGNVEAARAAFRDALNAADRLLAPTGDAYDELDSRGLALCGLALLEDRARASEAIEAFRASRRLTRAEGIVARVLRLFDALAVSDEAGVLATVRPAAAGEA